MNILELIVQFVVGGGVGVFFGPILIYIIGRTVISIREKVVSNEMQQVREEHNKKVQKIQGEYNKKRSEFLSMLGKYKKKIRAMKVIDREKVREMFSGEDEDVQAVN